MEHKNLLKPDGADRALLRYYDALLCASEEMLAAARAGEWDSVCRLEGACAVIVEQLRRASRGRELPEYEQPHRMRVLKAILANDAELRRLCGPAPLIFDASWTVSRRADQVLH